MQEGVTSVGPGPQRAEAPKGEGAVAGDRVSGASCRGRGRVGGMLGAWAVGGA